MFLCATAEKGTWPGMLPGAHGLSTQVSTLQPALLSGPCSDQPCISKLPDPRPGTSLLKPVLPTCPVGGSWGARGPGRAGGPYLHGEGRRHQRGDLPLQPEPQAREAAGAPREQDVAVKGLPVGGTAGRDTLHSHHGHPHAAPAWPETEPVLDHTRAAPTLTSQLQMPWGPERNPEMTLGN